MATTLANSNGSGAAQHWYNRAVCGHQRYSKNNINLKAMITGSKQQQQWRRRIVFNSMQQQHPKRRQHWKQHREW